MSEIEIMQCFGGGKMTLNFCAIKNLPQFWKNKYSAMTAQIWSTEVLVEYAGLEKLYALE
jgi:hypothetical protein